MNTNKISLKEEDGNIEQEVNEADVTPIGQAYTTNEDELMDREIEKEFNEAENELSTEDIEPQSENIEPVETQSQEVIEDVVDTVENESNAETHQDHESVRDTEDSLDEGVSEVIGDDSKISETLDDASDKALEESEDIEFSSPVQSVTTEDIMTEKSETEPEDISTTEQEEDQEENEEIIEFGSEISNPEEGDQESDEEGDQESDEEGDQEETSETAAEITKEELEATSESADEFKDEIAQGLGEEKKSFDDVFNDAMETAIKNDPTAESVVVIGYNKNDKTSDIKNIKIENFRNGTFRSPLLGENKNPEDLLTDTTPAVPVGTDKTAEESQNLLHEKIEELEENEIKGHLESESDKLNNPKGMPDLTKPFSGSHEFQEFDHLSFEDELVKQQDQIAEAMGESNEANPHDKYLKNQQQAKEALRLFAESDAIRRATQELPPGIPDQVFFSDLMGVSGVGKYEPSSNMLHYYGALSGFQGHFANKARSTISFEDVDTLTGLLSDMNGVFTTIFNLLPSKKEAEAEKDDDYSQKSNFDKAYDILKFYSRVRGFVHTLVYNRHLIVQDIQFLKDKVENLNSTQEDMLRFYGIEVEYARMVLVSNKYNNDIKIKKNLSNIRGVTYNFSQDVKLALKSLFTLEKAIIFFDNDVRTLSHNINTSNPYEALKTIDHVILMITRLFEVKLDLFESLVEMKTSLLNLKRYRGTLTTEIRNCEKLASYYDLIGAGIRVPSTSLTFTLVALFLWVFDRF
jgi:hypothetical protein